MQTVSPPTVWPDHIRRSQFGDGIRISVSALAAYARCPQQKKLSDLQRAGQIEQAPESLSATAFGSVMHHAVRVMEERHAMGMDDALEVSLATFVHYWEPEHIAAICDPVTIWLGRDTWGGLRVKGERVLRLYFDHLQKDRGKLLGLEVPFHLPYEVDGVTHELAGVIDRLSLRKASVSYISVEDFKTGRDYRGLRFNPQFSIYALSTLYPEFWSAWGDEGPEMYNRFSLLPRRGTWVSLRDGVKRSDAGWRGPIDYQRLELAIREYVRAVALDLYPLSLTGSVCEFCEYQNICGGMGLPDPQHGRSV